jgi:hypothetical protein
MCSDGLRCPTSCSISGLELECLSSRPSNNCIYKALNPLQLISLLHTVVFDIMYIV